MSISIVINADYDKYELPREVLQKYLQQHASLNNLPSPQHDTIHGFDCDSISRTDPLLVPIIEEFIKFRVQTNLHKISSARMLDIAIIPEYMKEYYTLQNINGKEHVVLLKEKYKSDFFLKIMARTDTDNDTKNKLAVKLLKQNITTQSFIEMCENMTDQKNNK